MTTFIAFISPAPILGFSYFRRYAKALLEASQFFSISTAVRMLSQLDFGKTMNFSIQYVMMRTSLGEVLLNDFLCVLQVTQQQ